MTTINGEVHVKYYDSNYNIPCYLREISQNGSSSLLPLRVSTEEHESITDKNNIIEGTEIEG